MMKNIINEDFEYIYLFDLNKEHLIDLLDFLIKEEEYEKSSLVKYFIDNKIYIKNKNISNNKIDNLINKTNKFFDRSEDFINEINSLNKDYSDLNGEEKKEYDLIYKTAKNLKNNISKLIIENLEKEIKLMEKRWFKIENEEINEIYQKNFNEILNKKKNELKKLK